MELNLEKPAILNLGGYVSGSKMQLQGDPLFLADLRTERYHIAAPPGVCGPNTGTSYSATGATADPRDRNKANASNPGSRYLWAGYMYLTPIVGVWNGSSIQGSQSGINKLGQYHCWNRTYDVSTGRWTTPDPAATPWWNLFDYADGQVGTMSDPTGLFPGDEEPMNGPCINPKTGGSVPDASTGGARRKEIDDADHKDRERRKEERAELLRVAADERKRAAEDKAAKDAEEARLAGLTDGERAAEAVDLRKTIEKRADSQYEADIKECKDQKAICLTKALKTFAACSLVAGVVAAITLATGPGAAGVLAGGLAACTAALVVMTDDCEGDFDICKRKAGRKRKDAIK